MSRDRPQFKLKVGGKSCGEPLGTGFGQEFVNLSMSSRSVVHVPVPSAGPACSASPIAKRRQKITSHSQRKVGPAEPD